MHDFLVDDLRKVFPSLADEVRITMLEATGHILNTFDEELGAYTANHFRRQKIAVRTNAPVMKVDATRVYLKDGAQLEYGLLVWSTGIGPTQLIQSLPFAKDKFSRMVVNNYLQVEEVPEIYALGDCAVIAGENFPVTAQVAQQEGIYLGRSLNRRANNKMVKPFHYSNLGMLAYIGGSRALADLSAFKGRGFLTWLFWRSVYLTRLVSVKNKILVIFDWLKTLVFGRDVSRF
jgi:NADH:quinone reductase (non-electrogenic)